MFLELNSKRLHQSSGKENKSRCLAFTSSTKREIRHFHVVVVQRRLRKVKKIVMHRQRCCFAKLNQLLFCYSRCRCRCGCLRSLMGRLRVAFKWTHYRQNLLVRYNQCFLDIQTSMAEISIVNKNSFSFLHFLFWKTSNHSCNHFCLRNYWIEANVWGRRPHVRKSITVLDSGLHTGYFGFKVLDSE